MSNNFRKNDKSSQYKFKKKPLRRMSQESLLGLPIRMYGETLA